MRQRGARTVKQRLGGGRATGDVDVDRDDSVTPSDDGIGLEEPRQRDGS
jgi:hypothetical protein